MFVEVTMLALLCVTIRFKMYVEVTLFLVLCIALRYFQQYFLRIQQGLPPGKMGIPFLGIIPFVGSDMYGYIEKLRRNLGDIYCMKLGHHMAVVISDYDMIKSVMNNPDAQGRPEFYSFSFFAGYNNRGTIFSNGPVHVQSRRHTMRFLKDFGMGRSLAEEIIHNEVKALLKELEKIVDVPTELNSIFCFNVAVLNVIWRMVADRQFDLNDKVIHDFCEGETEDTKVVHGPMALLDLFPWLVPIVPRFLKLKWMKQAVWEKHMEERFKLYQESIDDHIASLDRDNPRDLLDAYLIEMKRIKRTPEKHYETLDDLKINMDNMFAAGMETLSSTMRWILIYMVMFPEVQHRVQQEIDKALPRDKLPTLRDRDSLMYCEAVIHEVHRKASFVPMALPHTATKDIHVNGYTIPKNTILLINSRHCHFSRKYWRHPDKFYPEHFLDDKGKVLTKKDGFMPFGIGRRQCLGESLARGELFLFFVGIMQKFTICAAPGDWPTEKCDPNVFYTRVPLPFKFILKLRKPADGAIERTKNLSLNKE